MADLDQDQKNAAARAYLETLDRGALIEIILTQRVLIEELQTVVALLQKENKELRARIEGLEAKVRRNSTNSHKPPSSDPPGMGKGLRDGHLPHDGPKRKRGGQPGHKGSNRELLSEEEVDAIVDCIPETCSTCGQRFEDQRDPEPERRQVTDLPPIRPTTIEFRRHTLGCSCCGAHTTGELPSGTPSGAFGPRVQALIGLLSGAYRLSHRCIETMLGDCFGLSISLGSITNQEAIVSEALAEPVNEAVEYVQEQPAKHADETGWRECSKRAWLWLVATPLVAIALIRQSRGAVVAKELLGNISNWFLVSDRWSGYNWVPTKCRQACWAHLIRDFRKLADSGNAEAQKIGIALLEQSKRLFKLWARVRDGTLKRSSFRTYASPIRQEVRRLLAEGASLPVKNLSGMCKEILKLEPAMWTFLRIEGVPPTNNHCERLVRHAVMWRKTSYGTQSEKGSRFVERILTAVTSLRLQKRNVLEYLTEACWSALARRKAPSLIPTSA